MNHLPRLAIHGNEGGAEDLMAAGDFLKDAPQRFDIQIAAEAQCGGDVVERAARLHLVEEPEALLGEREGDGAAVAGCRPQRRRRVPDRGLRRGLQVFEQLQIFGGKFGAAGARSVDI